MAKKMILVEEHVYNDLLKRPTIDTSKSYINSELQSQLASTNLSDDVKAKLHQKTLRQFLTLKQQVPDLQPVAFASSTSSWKFSGRTPIWKAACSTRAASSGRQSALLLP